MVAICLHHVFTMFHQVEASASAARILALSVRPWSNSIAEKEAGRWRKSWPKMAMFSPCFGEKPWKIDENHHPIPIQSTKQCGKPVVAKCPNQKSPKYWGVQSPNVLQQIPANPKKTPPGWHSPVRGRRQTAAARCGSAGPRRPGPPTEAELRQMRQWPRAW